MYVQVNLCQKLLFLHQLTNNMTTDCSWNYYENYKRRIWAEHGQFHEQSFVILWVSWCKNKCFWKRFTCSILKTFGKISTPEEAVIHKRLNMEWRLSNSCSYKKKEEKEDRKKGLSQEVVVLLKNWLAFSFLLRTWDPILEKWRDTMWWKCFIQIQYKLSPKIKLLPWYLTPTNSEII